MRHFSRLITVRSHLGETQRCAEQGAPSFGAVTVQALADTAVPQASSFGASDVRVRLAVALGRVGARANAAAFDAECGSGPETVFVGRWARSTGKLPSFGCGRWAARGLGTAQDRYVVDLGRIDLSRPNRQSFKMRGLPSVEFTMGLRQVNVSAGCDATAFGAVRVALNVQADDGAVVVAENAPLADWAASPHLVYRRGAERQEPRPGGAVEFVRTGVRASGGWGTYFTPRSHTTYVAQLEVISAQDASGCESRLVLLGGVWK